MLMLLSLVCTRMLEEECILNTNDKARDKIISTYYGVAESVIDRVKQKLSSVPLQIPAFEAGKDDELYYKILNRMNDAFLPSAKNAFDSFWRTKRVFNQSWSLVLL